MFVSKNRFAYNKHIVKKQSGLVMMFIEAVKNKIYRTENSVNNEDMKSINA